jgi:hypothetical protein
MKSFKLLAKTDLQTGDTVHVRVRVQKYFPTYESSDGNRIRVLPEVLSYLKYESTEVLPYFRTEVIIGPS